MISLNDIVNDHIRLNSKKIKGKYFMGYMSPGSILVEWDFDKNMPKIYEDDDLDKLIPIGNTLIQLTGEMEQAYPKRVMYRTQLCEQSQKVMILHNGNQIPEESLVYSNKILLDIAENKRDWTGRHGNLIAGHEIKKLGGRILLENIEEDGYKVRTTVEIPVKQPSF